jgi:hypothetical protein
MVYKIALVGSHSVGKTALISSIESKLKQRGIEAKRIDEVSTMAKEIGLPINKETTLEAQLWILHTHFARELLYSQHSPNRPNYDVVICDRGPDNYCYLENNVGPNQPALSMTLDHLEMFPYDRVYLLPVTDSEITIGTGTRSLEKEFQLEMDKEIRTFLKEHNIEHIELPTLSSDNNFRNAWKKVVLNQTLTDLNKPKEHFI